MEPWHGGGPNKRMVSCQNDSCWVRPMNSEETQDEAIAAWNTRAAPPELTALIDAARDFEAAIGVAGVEVGSLRVRLAAAIAKWDAANV